MSVYETAEKIADAAIARGCTWAIGQRRRDVVATIIAMIDPHDDES